MPEIAARTARATWPAASMVAIMRTAPLRHVPALRPVMSESATSVEPDAPDLLRWVQPDEEADACSR